MDIEEKYRKLRTAVLEMTGIPDDKGTMLLLMQEINKQGRDEAILKLLVTLIETHGE